MLYDRRCDGPAHVQRVQPYQAVKTYLCPGCNQGIAPGTAIIAGPLTVRGNTVYLDHGAGVVTGYFHLSEIAVRPGDRVAAGQRIGAVGGTGLTTGPHLHWEVRVNGRWTNPYYWLERPYP